MSIYPEMLSSTYQEIGGVKFFVRKYGLDGVVYEEELVPMPTEKITRTLDADGVEDVTKQVVTVFQTKEK